MFNKSKTSIALLLMLVIGMTTFVSCKKDDKKKVQPSMSNNGNNNPTQLASTPLYDTLGWFIQGASSSMTIEGQGTKMVPDPDNSGQTIQAGRLAIRTVVNNSLQVIAGDTILAEYFPTLLNEVGNGNTTGLADLLNSFTDFVQQAVSGQMVYNGKSMVEAHNHATYSRFGSSSQQYVTDSTDFDQFVGDIVQASQALNVPNSVIGQLGTILYSTEGAVVHTN